jgi:hypothetical protein
VVSDGALDDDGAAAGLWSFEQPISAIAHSKIARRRITRS